LLDRNEKQDSGLRRSLVERDKEEDGFVRLGLEETTQGDTVGGARRTIKTGFFLSSPVTALYEQPFASGPSATRPGQGAKQLVQVLRQGNHGSRAVAP
jgi:hypothetical protein